MIETTDPISKLPLDTSIDVLPYQKRLIDSQQRFTWSCWARQTGKSFTLSLRRVMQATTRGRTQLLLSAGMRQSRELMVKVQQHCQALRIAADFSNRDGCDGRRDSQIQALLPNGARVIALPARPETIRGYTGDVLLDEFAMHADDRAIWAAIFPTILRSDGELDIASTPKGRDNLFYQLGQNPSFERTILTLPEAIQQGLNVDMELLRKAMGDEELFRQEFLCEFLDESLAFLPYGVIVACEDDSVAKDVDWATLRESQADVYVGVDIARKRDLTVIWLWRMQTPERQATRTAQEGMSTDQSPQLQLETWTLRCAGLIEMAGAPFTEQQETIHRVLQLRCVRRCCIDATGMGWPLAEWAQDAFGRGRVEAVTFTAGLKAQMASQLRRLAEERRLRIPADDSIRSDWHSLRRSTNASGGLRLDAGHSEGGHADRFWAAALAIHAVDNGPAGPAEYTGAGQLRWARDGAW